MAVPDQLQAVIANHQYDAVSAILDAAELEVSGVCCGHAEGSSPPVSERCLCGDAVCVPPALQSPNPAVLDDGWPYALHLLGHMYNKNL